MGQLPEVDADFGDAAATGPLRAACEALELAALCRAAAPVVEQLLRTMMWHLDRIIDLQPRLSRDEAIAQVAQEFHASWIIEKGQWDAVLALLQGLGELAHMQWDELRGRINSRPWREAQRISLLLAKLPEVTALIARLGRAERSAAFRAAPPQAMDATAHRVLGVKLVQTVLPDAPGELRGIRHSDRIEGMLGSEAAMLLHPVLMKLWRARRAEARLLTYDSQAVLWNLRPDPGAPPRHDITPQQPEALERGPIIVCLDTSGSMLGGPEHIAKAVALQAMRTAHLEGRACLLIAFGAPDEIIERELSFTREGLDALLDLMGQSFDGGTDVQGPIERAIDRAHAMAWRSADVLIVSDGEFGCVPATLQRLDEAREQLGLRVYGVLVGDRETMGLMEVADHILWLRDWRRHGEGSSKLAASFSPVHSKSLTALFFPNALSPRAARHKPG